MSLKTRIAIFVFLAKLTVFLFGGYLHWKGNRYSDSFQELMVLLIPIPLLYLAVILRDIFYIPQQLKLQHYLRGRRALAAQIIPWAYMLLLLWIMFNYPTRLISTFQTLKMTVSFIEIGFGVYVGVVISDLYREKS